MSEQSPADAALQAEGPTTLRTMQFTDAELGLLIEALDSHVYWQLSDTDERNNGASTVEEGENPAIDNAHALSHRLEEAQKGVDTPPIEWKDDVDEDAEEPQTERLRCGTCGDLLEGPTTDDPRPGDDCLVEKCDGVYYAEED